MACTLKLPVGIDSFEKIRRNKFYYIDKTKLIEQLVETGGEVTLFTRPRRFGKTLNMSMLKAFFETGADESLFDGLYIANNMTKNYLDVISTKDRADVQNQYNKYVTYGAFPELVEIRNKRAFLNSIYQTVYLGDIITRNKITNDFAIRLILKKIAESVTKPLSYNRLTNILKSSGMSIGKQTVINYVSYMTDSYLLFTLQNYAAKLVEKETSPKYYFMDTGLLGLMLLDCKSAQLENLVAIELIRRYGTENVYFFENNIEIDFYIPLDNLAIQVSMQVLDNIDTRERETRAFVKLNNFIPNAKCILITNSEEAVIDCDGINIEVIPIWKWLLDN
jgi:uncharacterized protein